MRWTRDRPGPAQPCATLDPRIKRTPQPSVARRGRPQRSGIAGARHSQRSGAQRNGCPC
jgi:hypothetical protein